jgi:nucleotide-binding universal stress UspA family protein
MSTRPKPYHRLVAGIDGSATSSATLEWAAQQAHLTGSTLEVLSTWELPTSYGWALPIPSDFDPKAEAEHAIGGLIKTVQDEYPDLIINLHIVEGHPAPTLVGASREADLLVVGSRGHGAFTGMLLGSVSEHVAHHALCPVVIIH